jgi:replication-associated recombination protein RarA
MASSTALELVYGLIKRRVFMEPLAYRMSPRNLDEFFGQEHILGEGRFLQRAIK